MSGSTIKSTIGNRSLQFAFPADVDVLGHGRKEARVDYKEMVAHQLDSPIDFPSIMQSILEDDQIAIALEDGVPDGMAIASEVILYLIEHGVAPENITWVIGSTHRRHLELAAKELHRRGGVEVKTLLHDPSLIESHAYVAASQSGDAIYVQRDLIDADVLIPIYCARTPECPLASDLFGISPGFTDSATQQRWNIAWLEDNVNHLHEHEKLSEEAGWLAGIHFAVAVVPSMDGHVAEVLAGKPGSIYPKGTESLESVVNSPYDLVVAVVEGNAQQQSWLSIARAASYADRICGGEGRIVVCCDVDHATKGIRDLRSNEPMESANRRLIKSNVEDAFAAAVIRSILANRSLYLYSSLGSADCESLGIAHVQSPSDIEHLLTQAAHPCILRGAQY